MKIQVPEDLKASLPQSNWGKILSATPIIMTVVATMLAGLASSEMTRAQYDRALGAQQQSKAGDQWSFFQAKRLRGALQQNTYDLLQGTSEIHPIDAFVLTGLDATLGTAAGKPVLTALQTGHPPAVPAGPALDPKVQAAMDAVAASQSEEEISNLLSHVDDNALAAALTVCRDRTTAFDDAVKPVNQAIDHLDQAIGAQTSSNATLRRDFTAARLRYAAQRYEAEARLNQSIANILELQVRKSNISAEHHHRRSQQFFFGMLGAQMAVIIATFALAARQRSILWSIAAIAGIGAILFAGYVYLFL